MKIACKCCVIGTERNGKAVGQEKIQGALKGPNHKRQGVQHFSLHVYGKSKFIQLSKGKSWLDPVSLGAFRAQPE